MTIPDGVRRTAAVAIMLIAAAVTTADAQGLRTLTRARPVASPSIPPLTRLPDPWLHDDFGDGTHLAGSATFSGGHFYVLGSGGDYGTHDEGFHYVYFARSGSVSITAYIDDCTIPDPPGGGEQCGLMIRASLAANSANAGCFLQTNAPNLRIFQYRLTSGASTGDAGAVTGAYWLRLTYDSDGTRCEYSIDGEHWAQVGADQSVTFSEPYYVGMFANSAGIEDAIATGTFSDVTVDPAQVSAPPDEETILFDRTNPFWWDNDSELDVFSLAYALAATSNGDLNLIGMSRSPNPFAPATEDGEFVDWVQAAIDSGWNIDPALLTAISTNLSTDYMQALVRPMSEVINDTTPIDRGPAQALEAAVLASGTHDKPVVIGAGGPLTTIASAYLLAVGDGMGTQFADRAIVVGNNFGAWQWNEAKDYNSQQDEWALYIVMTRLRHVYIPFDNPDDPTMSGAVLTSAQAETLWSYLAALPSNPMADYIHHVQNDTYPYGHDAIFGDLGPILAVLYPGVDDGFFNQVKRVGLTGSWGAWPMGYPDHGANMLNNGALEQVLLLQDDPMSDDFYVGGYDTGLIVADFIDTFDRAFATTTQPDGDDAGGYRPPFTGFGFDSLGGRGTGSSSNICHITSLSGTSDGSSPTQIAPLTGGGHTYNGTLAQCLTANMNRFIVCDVSGTIPLTGHIVITNPYFTLAGQSCPGDGITIKTNTANTGVTDVGLHIYLRTHDGVIQHVRIRGGTVASPTFGFYEDMGYLGQNAGGLAVDHIIFDHVTMSWNLHLALFADLNVASNWAVYDSLFYEGLHLTGITTMTMLAFGGNGCTFTVQRTIAAHNGDRFPLVGAGCKTAFINNLDYDYGIGGHIDGQVAASLMGSQANCDHEPLPCADPDGGGPRHGDGGIPYHFEGVWIGNRYIWGASTGSDAYAIKALFGQDQFTTVSGGPTRLWLDDNVDLHRNRSTVGHFTDNTQGGQWNGVYTCSGSDCGGGYTSGVGTSAAVDDVGCTLAGGYGMRETNPACISWYTSSHFAPMSSSAAYTYDLAHAGARPVSRDYQDARIINEIETDTGAQILTPNSQYTKAHSPETAADGYPILSTTTGVYTNPANPWADGNCGTRTDMTLRWVIECDLETKAKAVEP